MTPSTEPSSRRVSIKDVAARAGVSWKTVSNVVNERPVVRPATRDRVLAAIAELGYVPNHVGRDLRGGPTRTLALVVPELVNPYFARLAQSLQHAARERGYAVSVEVSGGQREVEIAHLHGRTARPVDAVIMSPAALLAADVALRPAHGPRLVLLGEALLADPRTVHVAIDNVASAADVVRHLVDAGCTRPVFLGAEDRPRSTGTDRLAGFRAACRFAGLTPDPGGVLEVREWTREEGHSAVRALLDSGARFDAVVGGNDLLALGALAALRESGRSVPAEVAVVGWDDLPESPYAVPPLTSVAPDLEQLVAAVLDAALAPEATGTADGALVAREIVIPHRLVERGSTRARGNRSGFPR